MGEFDDGCYSYVGLVSLGMTFFSFFFFFFLFFSFFFFFFFIFSFFLNIFKYLDHQPVNLGYSCMQKSTIQHEFLHALGFFHEQARPDRDDHIKVNWKNINPDNKHNYKTIFDRGNTWEGNELQNFIKI